MINYHYLLLYKKILIILFFNLTQHPSIHPDCGFSRLVFHQIQSMRPRTYIFLSFVVSRTIYQNQPLPHPSDRGSIVCLYVGALVRLYVGALVCLYVGTLVRPISEPLYVCMSGHLYVCMQVRKGFRCNLAKPILLCRLS